MFASLSGFLLFTTLMLPLTAHAQASPFDTGFTALETLFTGTVAKVASLIAIVIGGYGLAHGEPGHKKALAGVAAGKAPPPSGRTLSFPKSATRLCEVRTPAP